MLTVKAKSTKHQELTENLRELARGMKPGERFPSQAELMKQFQVSDRTVLRSLDDLQRAGWIVRRHGSGTFVADPQLRAVEPPALSSVATATLSRTIATLTPAMDSFFKHCINTLMVQAEAQGFSLLCHHTQHPANYFEDALPLEALRPRGFILFSYSLLPVARRLIEHGHRAVVVGVPPIDLYPDAPTIYGDHERGGYIATRHLLDLGHRRIAYALRHPDFPHPLAKRFRWRGHLRAIEEANRAGQKIDSLVLHRETVDPWIENPRLAAEYFSRSDAPTGLVAWNDTYALLLLGILQRAGLRVPEDVSLIGFDALPDSDMSAPRLTTVDQHIGIQLDAALDILSRPDAPSPTHSVVIVPTLLSRESCAPPRS